MIARFARRYFEMDAHGATFGREMVAGVTTFVTMAYIIILNPMILQAAGIPLGPSTVATVLSAFFGTLSMGLIAKRPFAIAPYMGENAFIAYTVVGILGFSWQTALGAIFVSGVLFLLLTLCGVRQWLANSIPLNLKLAFAVGIGLFLTFIGLNETGIIQLGVEGAPVKVGNWTDPTVLLALGGFLLTVILMLYKFRAAILLGILLTTFAAFGFGFAKPPSQWISMPPNLGGIFLQLDVIGALGLGFLNVILIIFILDFVDTIGTLIGLSFKAGLLDEKGNLPDIDKPMYCDAGATVAAACFGTTTCGAYIESAAGIEAGGRTGLTAVVTAFCFLLALFVTPFVESIPGYAYGPAVILVGLLMMSPVAQMNFEDFTEAVPAFATIVLMSFTFNIGFGITAGFLLYPLLKTVAGKFREIPWGLWLLFAFSLLFYCLYPYN